MCGLAGLWNVYSDESKNIANLRKMVGQIPHRGPDANGFASGESWGVGHTRLSIVDLEGGNQPIWNETGEILIVGNNEIYNAPELRKALQELGHRFTTKSDTEVMLHGYEQWGESLFAKLNGMFAIILIDTKKKECVFARDPMGIKPLHFAQIGRGYAFASEIKSILELDGFNKAPDWEAAHLFMNFRYVPNEQTLFKGVERLAPGSYGIIKQDTLVIKRFFDLKAIQTNQKISAPEAKEHLSSLLKASVQRHLISDVEVGSYLSGGIDSSSVSSIAAENIPNLHTFCMGFGEPSDENSDARIVANNIKSNHMDLYVGDTPLDRLSEVLWHVEEPKVNCLQGYLLAEQVSKHLKVVLSGHGGDELFAGYVNNDILFPMAKLHRLFFSPFRSLSAVQSAVSPLSSEHFFRMGDLSANLGRPLSFYAILRNAFDHNGALLNSIYENPPSHWKNLSQEALEPYFPKDEPDTLNALLKLEARTKLPNDFLLTEDRVSMAHSLEVRVPLLDKELVEFAFSLPSSFKYRRAQKKWLLKEVATQWLSPEIINKKKWGFSFNPHLFYEKQLRSFAMQHLTEARVKEMGVFSWKWIDKVLSHRPHPRLRWHYFNLWVMAGFQIWHETFFGERQSELRLTGT